MKEEIVYMPLLGEGLEVSRPVKAVHQGEDIYLIVEQEVCSTEEWLFPPSSQVRCELHHDLEGTVLKATQRVEE
jgi:hypothetical protein